MAEAKVENKYERGKIYKVYNVQEPDKFYIGSTILELSEIFRLHKIEKHGLIHQEMKRLGNDNFDVELIELYPCNTWEELRMEEERIRK